MSGKGVSLRRGIRDALILGVHNLMPLTKSRRTAKRVIVLHDVETGAADSFRRHMIFLKEHFDILPLSDLLGAPPSGRVQVSLTFDDGYASWAMTAMPILSELGIPAVFFVCSGLVGLDDADSRKFYREKLRRTGPFAPFQQAHVGALSENPLFEIGSHTVNHANLGAGAGRGSFDAEISGDRDALQALTGAAVRYFAWPFGGRNYLSRPARAAIAKAGFDAAFTTLPGSFDAEGDPLTIGRDMLSLDESLNIWNARLHGAYDAISRLKN